MRYNVLHEVLRGATFLGVSIVLISHTSDLCSVVQSEANPPNSTQLIPIVGTPAAVAPGACPITTSTPLETTSHALLTFQAPDATRRPRT